MIKIDFEFDTPYGVFRDAIILPNDHTLSDAEIEAMKIARRDAWIDSIENPPPEPPPETIEVDGVTYQRV